MGPEAGSEREETLGTQMWPECCRGCSQRTDLGRWSSSHLPSLHCSLGSLGGSSAAHGAGGGGWLEFPGGFLGGSSQPAWALEKMGL